MSLDVCGILPDGPISSFNSNAPPAHQVVCTLHDEVLIPSLLVLLCSSVFCTLFNAAFNAFGHHLLYYYRSITTERQRLLRVSKHSMHVNFNHSFAEDILKEVELETRRAAASGVAENDDYVDATSPLLGNARAFFKDMKSERPLEESPESPMPIVASPVIKEALSMSLQEMRLQSQTCLFNFHPLYMTISTLKCLAVILMVQYHFDSIPGGWRRFCICGAGNLLSATCTPMLEYVSNLVLPLENKQDKQAPAPGGVAASAAAAAAAIQEEDQKDSLFIVEILVRIGSLQLTDLMTVLIQGSTFVIFAAIFLPMSIVFCIPGFLSPYSWPLYLLLVFYGMIRSQYYASADSGTGFFHRFCFSLPSCLRPQRASVAVAFEFLKAMLLKILTLFVLQVCMVMSFVMGMALLDGLTFRQAGYFVMHHVVSFGLVATISPSRYQVFTLLSQLFF